MEKTEKVNCRHDPVARILHACRDGEYLQLRKILGSTLFRSWCLHRPIHAFRLLASCLAPETRLRGCGDPMLSLLFGAEFAGAWTLELGMQILGGIIVRITPLSHDTAVPAG